MQKKALVTAALLLTIIVAGLWTADSLLNGQIRNMFISQPAPEPVREGGPSTGAVAQANAAVDPNQDNLTGPPVALEFAPLQPASAAAVYPFDVDTPILESAPELPSELPPVVYIAPVVETGSRAGIGYTADALIRFGMLAATKDRLAMNLLPYYHHLPNCLGNDEDSTRTVFTEEEYLRNASAIMADYCIAGEAGQEGDNITLALTFYDLATSRTEQYTSTTLFADVGGLLEEGVIRAAKFCGVPQDVIEECALGKGMPNGHSFTFLVEDYLSDWKYGQADYLAALKADPGCIKLYDVAIRHTGLDSIEIANQALREWPDNINLLYSKVTRLSNLGEKQAALQILSELLRRYPYGIITAHKMPGYLKWIYPQRQRSHEIPAAYEAAVISHVNLGDRYPNNWGLQWDLEALVGNLAYTVRGTRTIDRVPEKAQDEFTQLNMIGLNAIDRAAEALPGCPRLLEAQLNRHFLLGHTDWKWQQEIIERIHEVDPNNYRAELSAAYTHSIGWSDGQGYLPIIEATFERHRDNPKALSAIAESLATDMDRITGLAKVPREKVLAPNEESDLFIEVAEAALAAGKLLDDYTAKTLSEAYVLRGQQEKADALKERRDAVFMEVVAMYKAGEYQKAVDEATERLKSAEGQLMYKNLKYELIRGMRKIGKSREAFAESILMLKQYPDQPYFHYLFAELALELNTQLPEAREHALQGYRMHPDYSEFPMLKEFLPPLPAK